MARPLRIQFPGAVYHLMSRGDERQPIVHDDADRQCRLDWLRRTVENYGWRLYAFVLLSNHDHLLIATPDANLCAGMQYFNGSYTNYFNRRHRRSGHLFYGRFRGHLVEKEVYLLELSRYIHLNPVRAGLVDRPEQWPWSSYIGYINERKTLGWLDYEAVLSEFGKGEMARRQYARFVNTAVDEPPQSPFAEVTGGFILGSADFVERIKRLVDCRPHDAEVPQLKSLSRRPSLQEIATVVASQFGSNADQWVAGRRDNKSSRAAAAYIARRRFGYTAGEVAQAFGYRSHGSVRSALARVESADHRLHKAIAELDRRFCY